MLQCITAFGFHHYILDLDSNMHQLGFKHASRFALINTTKYARMVLQEHPLLAWPLFIFLLILTLHLYPEDYTCIHMHYLFWLVVLSPYLFWLYSFWSSSYSLVLYLLAGSLARSPMPFPLYWYPSYYNLSPIPYYWSMTSSPLTLTTSPVDDSVPHYPYHSLSLWLNHPSALTLPLVSDSFLVTYLFLYYYLQPGLCLSPLPI
jgi:hypothetical protein